MTITNNNHFRLFQMFSHWTIQIKFTSKLTKVLLTDTLPTASEIQLFRYIYTTEHVAERCLCEEAVEEASSD